MTVRRLLSCAAALACATLPLFIPGIPTDAAPTPTTVNTSYAQISSTTTSVIEASANSSSQSVLAPARRRFRIRVGSGSKQQWCAETGDRNHSGRRRRLCRLHRLQEDSSHQGRQYVGIQRRCQRHTIRNRSAHSRHQPPTAIRQHSADTQQRAGEHPAGMAGQHPAGRRALRPHLNWALRERRAHAPVEKTRP